MQGEQCRVWVALLRLPEPYDTDVVMSWNEANIQPEQKQKEAFAKLIQSVEFVDIDFMK